ncbi:hypothetical protein COW20_15175 [bacterium (Candidatus Blackallbacteria) CG13_big_fil_rev_8_21_14_2_50_49_14]|nr:MAG: hypothetical protein COW64_15015 [bacterium (Candidatus Blackallbacteria) CG18_big_fil_WC_8_21_14_2_50_49_26]PIW46629.1 MAG: hypothetical protein COW20_15175 [bacterium (Candidatus Blackallbacteria) CG13_big_fil_rev_8_21_14_2_50_49_14]
MTLTLEWGQVAWASGLAVAWSALLIGVIQRLVSKVFSSFEKKVAEENKQFIAQLEANRLELQRVEAEFRKLLVELPIQYQRRDDTIRDQTVLNAKLDKVYEIMLELKRNA